VLWHAVLCASVVPTALGQAPFDAHDLLVLLLLPPHAMP
jgi:hypothetical protein